MVSLLTEFFMASPSSPKRVREVVPPPTSCVLSNSASLHPRSSQDHRGRQAAIHGQGYRRRWDIGIWSILSCTSRFELTSVVRL